MNHHHHHHHHRDRTSRRYPTIRVASHSKSIIVMAVALITINYYTPPTSDAMQIRRTWTTKHWCESVKDPEWPFAYSKFPGQREEKKGRVLSNRQDVRHECQTKGVASKCHICEQFQCGGGNGSNGSSSTSFETCHFQLQGVSTDQMSKNIPTVSDVPWAVGGSHRYDFGGLNTSHVCMYMSGGSCQSSYAEDYSKCKLRCWGYEQHHDSSHSSDNHSSFYTNKPGDATIVEGESSGRWPNARNDYLHGVRMTPWTLPMPTQTWSFPKQDENQIIGNPRNNSQSGMDALPQGFTFTLAGGDSGEQGFLDGWGCDAR